MILECGVPDERLTVEPERGNPIAEAFDGAGRGGANGGAESLEAPSRGGRQGREVGAQLRPGPFGVV